MSPSGSDAGEKIRRVTLGHVDRKVDLLTGRAISDPLPWFPRLLHATAEQRAN